MRNAVILLMVIFVCGGCMTMTPAIGGKTNYDMTFSDVVPGEVNPETGIASAGQATNYHVKFSAPSGVKVEGLAAMGYDWQADGSGKIKVSSEGTADTTAQAAMISQVAQIYSAATQAAIESSLTALAPVLSQYVGGKIEVDKINAAKPSTQVDVNALVDSILATAPTAGERSGLAQMLLDALTARTSP
uniref:Uncharacterized protein n=2 Tax=viral metagenome TaxID=1070528 RepID=A0A6M3JY92_9ZZZZ